MEVQNSDFLGFITTPRYLCKRVNLELNNATGVRVEFQRVSSIEKTRMRVLWEQTEEIQNGQIWDIARAEQSVKL
jgi:hypothetical protein